MNKVKTAILISGRGSNMTALINAAKDPDFPAEIVIVISNVPSAKGLEKAQCLGIKTDIIDHSKYASRDLFENSLNQRLALESVELVCLAGFMRILGPIFMSQWPGRLLNIHPSLLPAFRGLHTHEKALEAGVKIHGCTVHHVVPDLDAGPIISQAAVPVVENDTDETLAARVLEAELKLYPDALRRTVLALQGHDKPIAARSHDIVSLFSPPLGKA
jgi:phosphoribosylglycinamide formyltransferase-1